MSELKIVIRLLSILVIMLTILPLSMGMNNTSKQLQKQITYNTSVDIDSIGNTQKQNHYNVPMNINGTGNSSKNATQHSGGYSTLEVFAVGSDGALWHRWQLSWSDFNSWSNWESLGGKVSSPVVAQNADHRLEVFGIGPDKALWHKWQTSPYGAWSDWASLGGSLKKLTISRNGDGRIELFGIGTDNAVWHIWQVAPSDGWSEWSSLGGSAKDIAETNSLYNGIIELAVVGSDNNLYINWQSVPNGPFVGWYSEGGSIDEVAAQQDANDAMQIFGRGGDHAVWKFGYNIAGNDWLNLGGNVGPIAVGLNWNPTLHTYLDLFARGQDGTLWHKGQYVVGGQWSDWYTMGGYLSNNKPPAIGYQASGTMVIFGIGGDGAIWFTYNYPGQGWSQWQSLGGNVIDGPAVITNFGIL